MRDMRLFGKVTDSLKEQIHKASENMFAISTFSKQIL